MKKKKEISPLFWNPVAGRRGNLVCRIRVLPFFLCQEGGGAHSVAWGTLVLRRGIEPRSPAVEAWRLRLSTPRGVLLPLLSALLCGAFAISQQLDGVYTVTIPGPSGG